MCVSMTNRCFTYIFLQTIAGLPWVQGTGMGENFSSSSENLRTNWTQPMDHCFLELLLDQVSRGNKNGNVFIKEAWTEMIARFNDKFGFKHKTDVLKNRYKWLRKQFSNVKILIQNGFSWDEKQQMVTADNQVWDDYIKVRFLLNVLTHLVRAHFTSCLLTPCVGPPWHANIQGKSRTILQQVVQNMWACSCWRKI